MYNDTHIPRSSVDAIVNNVQDVSNSLVPFLQRKIADELKQRNNFTVEEKINLVLDENKYLFREIKTEKLRFWEYKNNSIYTEPEILDIGTCAGSDVESLREEELPTNDDAFKVKSTKSKTKKRQLQLRTYHWKKA